MLLGRSLVTLLAVALLSAGLTSCSEPPASAAPAIPRTADGKPDFQGIWQVRNRAAVDLEGHVARHGMPAGSSVVKDGPIPYQEWAVKKKAENFANRTAADPLNNCFLPGVPRIMYMEFPFQIFQTPDLMAMTFEWSQVYRPIHLHGGAAPEGIDFWMGDSRGKWDGDTLVVDVKYHNDRTWFDMSGNFHSGALQVVERYSLANANTIYYEATITDPKVFTKPWTIAMSFHRVTDEKRIFEYQCQAEAEEARGDFERDPNTWYPGPGVWKVPAAWKDVPPAKPWTAPKPTGEIKRLADGKPDMQGFFLADPGGANYGLSTRERVFLMPETRGIIYDPPDGKLPMQEWAKAEAEKRNTPERGYDDPTAHCFVPGVPRAQWVPGPTHILQPPGYVVILNERMSWRAIPLDGRAHLPDHMRLWQGDSVGKWEGDTLVVETTNLNGKPWLNEIGEIISHAATVVERFTPLDADTIQYDATISDPQVYTRHWSVSFPVKREEGELLEVACHEGNEDLAHLKEIRDQARAKKRQ
jgi:hypothetical protein